MRFRVRDGNDVNNGEDEIGSGIDAMQVQIEQKKRYKPSETTKKSVH